jgi:hypothetical protein
MFLAAKICDMRVARLLALGLLLVTGLVSPSVRAAVPVPACSWFGETDQRDVNIGAPDLDAYYWANPIAVTSGETVTIDGTYPSARYFSFHVYDRSGQPLDSLYDAQLAPSKGSVSPFRPGKGTLGRGSYAMTIRFTAAASHRAANTLYAPVSAPGIALLVYRVYVPSDPGSPQGGVTFPRITLHPLPGVDVRESACSTTPPPFGSALWSQAAQSDHPAVLPPSAVPGAQEVPVWQRQFGSALGNQQNAYLAALLSRQYGDLVVIHVKAPSFPDNRRGVSPSKATQLRYWSFCVYDTQGEAGFGCAADYTAPLRDGNYTYVVSDPGQRPSNADAADGVTWLPWGGTQDGAQVVFRNMLPNPGFSKAAQRITSSARAIMGPYYPRAVYCSKTTFERGGWRACFGAGR